MIDALMRTNVESQNRGPSKCRVLVLTALNPLSWILINSLAEQYGPIFVLNEDKQPRWDLLRRRIGKQGGWTVLGQICFVLFQRALSPFMRRRVKQIIQENNLTVTPRADTTVINIGSVNSHKARETIQELGAKVIVVIGTRIIGRATIDSIKVPLLNVHAGITPKYRGQAGGYWALAAGDETNAGITVHLIDQGVDTGPILYQERFAATRADSFDSYFYLQYAAARNILSKAVADALDGSLLPQTVDLPSQQFYHPTIWSYLRTAVTSGVW